MFALDPLSRRLPDLNAIYLTMLLAQVIYQRMICRLMNDEWKIVYKISVMIYLKVLSKYYAGRIEEKYETTRQYGRCFRLNPK
jgi:hypothetical protein